MSFLKNQKKIKGAELFIKCLEEEGVEYIFGLPGEENLDFLECLCKSNKIKLILTRHEQGAGFMAATYGRLTGKAGVCLTTLGPGATNLVTGIATAQMDSIPLIIVTGQVGRAFIGTDAFQETDIFGITLPIVKHSYVVRDPRQMSKIVAEAFFSANLVDRARE